jgi:hypothetical protein
MASAAPVIRSPWARYVLTPPSDTRPSLIVQLCPEVTDDVLDDLRAAMRGEGCANGIAVDPERLVVLRDTYVAQGSETIAEDFRLDTSKLLPGAGDLDLRLERWLNLLAKSWPDAVPREQWAAPLFADVVPAAADTVIRRRT